MTSKIFMNTLVWDPATKAYRDPHFGMTLGHRYRKAARKLENLYHSAFVPKNKNTNNPITITWEQLGLAGDLLAMGYHINCVSRFVGINSYALTQRIARWFPELNDVDGWYATHRNPENPIRNQAIEALIKQGWSDNAIAKRLGNVTRCVVAGVRYRYRQRLKNVHQSQSQTA